MTIVRDDICPEHGQIGKSWSDVGRSWLDVALGSNLDQMWLRETRKGVPIKLDFQSASCCAIGELGLGC